VLSTFWACAETSANCCLALSATDAVILYSIYVYLVSIALLVVAHHRQEYVFHDFSLIAFKFPDFSMFSRLAATLLLRAMLPSYHHNSKPTLSFYRPDALFASPNQQCQSSEGIKAHLHNTENEKQNKKMLLAALYL